MVNDHLRDGVLTSYNTSFASVNRSKPVWWLNINSRKFKSEFHILLAKNPGLIWLRIEANTFPYLESVFRIRLDKDAVDLEIASGGSQYMRDTKSGGVGYDFRPHIECEWNYPCKGASSNPVAQIVDLNRESKGNPDTLEDIRDWMLERLLKFKQVFGPRLDELG